AEAVRRDRNLLGPDHGPAGIRAERGGPAAWRDDGRRPVLRLLRPHHRPQRCLLQVPQLRQQPRLQLATNLERENTVFSLSIFPTKLRASPEAMAVMPSPFSRRNAECQSH